MSLIIIAFTKGVKMSKTIIILPNISICEKHINQNTIITIIAATLMNAIDLYMHMLEASKRTLLQMIDFGVVI